MPDFSNQSSPVLPLFVNAAGEYGLGNTVGRLLTASIQTIAARTWVANLIAYSPVSIPWDYPVNRVWWVNGSTITSTNVQFGIYTSDGTRIYTTGTVAASGASSVQYVTPSPAFMLRAGSYYFAWTCNNTTSRGYAVLGAASASLGRLSGMLEETPGGFGLPGTMTPVAFNRAWGPNICGVTRTTTGF